MRQKLPGFFLLITLKSIRLNKLQLKKKKKNLRMSASCLSHIHSPTEGEKNAELSVPLGELCPRCRLANDHSGWYQKKIVQIISTMRGRQISPQLLAELSIRFLQDVKVNLSDQWPGITSRESSLTWKRSKPASQVQPRSECVLCFLLRFMICIFMENTTTIILF